MTLLDIAGSGLFAHSDQFLSVLGSTAKVIGGSFAIALFALFAFVAVIVRAVFTGIRQSSVLAAAHSLIRNIAYAAGISLALFFMLIVTVLFSISFSKVFLISIAIALISSFIIRESILFLLLKRFGKYIFYLTTLHRAGKVAYQYVKEENNDQNPR